MKTRQFISNHRSFILALLGGLAGALLILYITTWGPWAFTDSVSYVEAARNLASGGPFAEIRATGTVIPFDKQPPLYPSLLALGLKVGLSLIESARLIDVVSFGMLVFSVGMLTGRLTSRPWLPTLAMLAILPSPLLLEATSGVMTEALFLMLCFVGLAILAISISEDNPSLLPWSALAVALSAMTRYAGIVSIATGLTAILLLSSADLKTRVKRAAQFSLITLLPLLIWVVSRLATTSQLSASQILVNHPWQMLETLRVKGATIIWSWLPILGTFDQAAYRLKLGAEILIGLLLLSSNLWLYFRTSRDSTSRPVRLTAIILLLQTAFHLFFMIGVSLFGPWDVRIDPRQLTPVFLFGTLGLLVSLEFGTGSNARRWTSFSLQFLLVAALFGQNISADRELIEELHNQGNGYTARAWHDSELIRAVQDLPSDVNIISNDIEGLMFHAGISAYRFTEIQEGIAQPIDEAYGTRPDDPLQLLYAQDCAAIVIIANETRLIGELYGGQTQARLRSMVSESYEYYSDQQGGIYFFDESCVDF